MELDEVVVGGDDGDVKKKRRGGGMGREWKCEVERCSKDFESVRSFSSQYPPNPFITDFTPHKQKLSRYIRPSADAI
jgi:hypothetical protein